MGPFHTGAQRGAQGQEDHDARARGSQFRAAAQRCAMNHQQRQQSRSYKRRISRGGSSHTQGRRVPGTRAVVTWCAQVGVISYSWSVHGDWHEGDATLRGQRKAVSEVFRGVTVEDCLALPVLPHQTLTEEERRNQCVLCGVREVQRRTHRLRKLHPTREMAARYVDRQGNDHRCCKRPSALYAGSYRSCSDSQQKHCRRKMVRQIWTC